MAIVNGTYVQESLPDARTAQQQVFNQKYTNRDMNDYSTAAYNYLMKQQEQAYNLQLWQLQNEYNSPAAQMQRYQDAGLNPNLIYSQQNSAQAPASASAPSFRSGGTFARNAQNAINTIGQIMNTVKAARDTYDYIKYGAEASAWNKSLTMQRSQAQALENYWNTYLLGLGNNDPESSPIPTSLRARMYGYQMDTQQQRYEQLKAVVSSIPDQRARSRALTDLDKYRLQILQGQYGAIMSINTGNHGVDSFLRMLGFYLLGK